MKNIMKENKLLVIPFCISLFLGLFLGILHIKTIPLLLFSISINIFTIILIKMILKKLNINFNKKEKIWIITIISLIYLFYFVSVLGRKFIYYWDFSCYYNIQRTLESSFNTSIIKGIRYFVGSTWSGEYGCFLSFFPEIIFNFTNKTINSYVLSCVLLIVPYLIISFSILIKKLIEVFKIKKERFFFPIGLLVLTLFPIIHATFIYGQPDIFGLFFVFLIIALTIDYDFYKLDYERLFLIGILTFFLLITRRWYMYFILVYYLCYGLLVIISNFKDKNKLKLILKHAIIYILVMGLFLGVTLFPLFKNILVTGYSYEFYLTGGFKQELLNQINHLGYLLLSIIIIGIVFGIIRREYRKYSVLMLLEYFLIILIFTRMQNMGLHHSMLLVYIYLYFIYMFIILVINTKVIKYLIVIIMITNFSFGILNTNSKVFTDVLLRTPIQEDYNKILKVGSWLKDNLKDDNAYMITHNDMYNPDKFRNIYLPNQDIMNHLPYGSAIVGVHKFPIELFDSKYVITTSPFVNTSIEDKYNKVFNELVSRNVFKKVKEFDMKNGYTILIYERVEKVTIEEVELYQQELEDLSKTYPGLYKKILDDYIKKIK